MIEHEFRRVHQRPQHVLGRAAAGGAFGGEGGGGDFQFFGGGLAGVAGEVEFGDDFIRRELAVGEGTDARGGTFAGELLRFRW